MLNALAMLTVFLTDAQQSISVDKPLSVSLAKNGFDLPTLADFLLVAVGIGGIGVAIWTLRYIRRQADLMKTQADHMAVQNKNARDRERARFSIFSIDNPKLLERVRYSGDADKYVPVLIRMYLVKDGSSNAFNIRGFGAMSIVGKFDKDTAPNPDQWFNLQLPDTFRESGTEHPLPVTVTRLGGVTDFDYTLISENSDYTLITENMLKRIQSKELYLEIDGLISYDDVYGDYHETPFRFLWVQDGVDHGGDWWDGSSWVNFSGRNT